MSGDAREARRLHLLLPGDPLSATGGYIYDRRMTEGLRSRGWQVDVPVLDASFPEPTQAALAQAEQTLAKLASGDCVLIDGLALGAMPEVVARHAERLRLIGLVHHPLAAETGLSAVRAHALFISEKDALRAVRGVIVTSPETALALKDYAVPEEHIRVVEPGTTLTSLAPPRASDGVALLCVATLTPRKGHDLLLRALAPLRHYDWHLTLAGSTERDASASASIRAQIEQLNLSARVTLTGELGEAALLRLYRAADVFVLPSRHEGYGMAVAEAIMQGLPIIATTTGAVARIVPADAGILVPPDDAVALEAALARVLGNAALRTQFSYGAQRARHALRSWSSAVDEMQAALLAFAGP
jgi:glycosyltransferase involved in cell wall biosynthesis